MLRPTYVFTEMKRHRATLIVLVDRSRSMSVADEFSGMTRWKRLTDEVAKALPSFRDLNQDLDVKFYTFDSDVAPLDVMDGKFTLGDKADGTQTAMGAALDDALRNEVGHRMALAIRDHGVDLHETDGDADDGAARARRRVLPGRWWHRAGGEADRDRERDPAHQKG